jgi:hypothetical protein
MKNIFTTFLLLIIFTFTGLCQSPLRTFYEQSGCTKTPRYAETIAFCKQLDEASAFIKYTTFGVSPQGRELPLLIVDSDANFDPQGNVGAKKAIVMLQACIHPGEPEGKDAGFILLRKLIENPDFKKQYGHVTLLFIPILNVDGHERFGPYNRINQNGPDEMGWRTTAQNLNLNRDFLKADAPEMQHWLKLFHAWKPDFFIDTHTTDGADYQYVITYGMETHGNADPHLTDWLKKKYIPEMEAHMFKAGFPVFPYVSFRNWHDPRSGLEIETAPPMLSHGYCAAANRPGLLIETHMLKPYKQRVEATIEMLDHCLHFVNTNYTHLIALNQQADKACASPSFRETPFPIRYALSTKDSTMVDFLGIEYEIVKSDLTGGDWFKYSNKPITMKLPVFDVNLPEETIKLPEYYIIPPEWAFITQKLQLHGIALHYLLDDLTITASAYKLSNPKWRNNSYEGHITLEIQTTEIEGLHTFPKGSAVVDMNQAGARIVAALLEPRSNDSFLYWGFMNILLEQKEYAETYVMEKMAREMIAKDPKLKDAFELEKKSNPAMADHWVQTNWFYQHTPYFDSKVKLYPIGKLFNRQSIPVKMLTDKPLFAF